MVFDFKICPFWVDEGGQPRSMLTSRAWNPNPTYAIGALKSKDSRPDPTSQIHPEFKNLRCDGYRSRYWKPHPGCQIQILGNASFTPDPEVQVQTANPNSKIPIPKSNSMNPPTKFWDPNPVAQIQKSNSNNELHILKSKSGISNPKIQI